MGYELLRTWVGAKTVNGKAPPAWNGGAWSSPVAQRKRRIVRHRIRLRIRVRRWSSPVNGVLVWAAVFSPGDERLSAALRRSSVGRLSNAPQIQIAGWDRCQQSKQGERAHRFRSHRTRRIKCKRTTNPDGRQMAFHGAVYAEHVKFDKPDGVPQARPAPGPYAGDGCARVRNRTSVGVSGSPPHW
jgi:hypothetical protein